MNDLYTRSADSRPSRATLRACDAGLQARKSEIEERPQLERQERLAQVDQTDRRGSRFEAAKDADEGSVAFGLRHLIREDPSEPDASRGRVYRGLWGVHGEPRIDRHRKAGSSRFERPLALVHRALERDAIVTTEVARLL